MPKERKSSQSIKTIGSILDRRRTRSSGGALLELSTLANERERLLHELERWERRHTEIKTRLDEIGDKEQMLQTFVKNQTEPGKKPLPLAAAAVRVQTRELNY